MLYQKPPYLVPPRVKLSFSFKRSPTDRLVVVTLVVVVVVLVVVVVASKLIFDDQICIY